ncbi:hypothetical protein H2199_001800, partial [Coniosporium tulheliwenetii]
MASKQPLDPILYRNAEGDVMLIDIPTSIAAAQGTKDHPAFSRLLSSKPHEVPFATNNEPKSADAKSKLAANTVDAALDEEYRSLISRALAEINSNIQGDWCHPRELFSEVQLKGGNRELKKREDDKPGTAQNIFDDALPWSREPIEKSMARLAGLPQDLLPQLAEQCDSKHGDKKRFLVKYSCTETADETNSEEGKEKKEYLPYEPLQYNLDDSILRLTVLDNLITGKPAYTFRHLDHQQAGRTHHDPRSWGLFENLNVGLIEEWIWVKTTAKGEPVFALDSSWRKPYE